MRAIAYDRYGLPDVLSLVDAPMPVLGDWDVLVKVRAASINSWDWDLLRGEPFISRIDAPRRPKHKVLGADIAGEVVATGAAVTRFGVGDEVFGDLSEGGWGGFADYVCGREDALALKPDAWSFEQAAATPQAGLLALQALRKAGPIGPDTQVLMNGAGGGVGTFVLQLSKHFGAAITGVDHQSKFATMQAAGATQLVDYQIEDFTRLSVQWDVVVDVVCHRSIRDYRRALNPGGRAIVIGGATGAILGVALLGGPSRMVTGKGASLLIYRAGGAAVEEMADLFVSAGIAPVIDRVFPLEETPEAFRYFGSGLAKGKIVISVAG